MKTLKDYLVEEENKQKEKYIAIEYNDETQDKLRNYCEQNGFDLTKTYSGNEQSPENFVFHTTIFYSITKHNIENTIKYFKESKAVTPVSFEMIGHESNIPVIRVMSDDLKSLRTHYETEYGMKDEWPEWKPHISLSYSRNNIPDTENIDLPDFPLYFNKLIIEDIDKNE